MMHGLYSSATGLKTHGEGMNIISHNIANVNTVGYKQQMLLFQDLMYTREITGSTGANIVNSQLGMGSQVSHIRTLHTEGPFEPGNAITDLAINGKGFFEVTDDKGRQFYTRAGNFRFFADGVLRDPSGNAVSGIPLDKEGKEGGLGQVKINFSDDAVMYDPPKATTDMTALMNINVTKDNYADATDPYFSLLKSWDGTREPAIGTTGYAQPLTIYDAAGKAHTATIHFDQAPSPGNGYKVVEYIVTIPPDEDGRAGIAGTEGAGLLMSGTITFSESGEMVNMSSFTPTGGDLKDLSNWVPAQLVDGQPQLNITFTGQTQQTVGFNMGAKASAWNRSPGNAAAVGTDFTQLPGMSSPEFDANRTTAFPKSSALAAYRQDGYPVGDLSDMYVDESGYVIGRYSNGQSHELYRIPVFRFTSEDGLRREGNNLYSATKESGNMSHGMAGTENYGGIQAGYLEQSNTDMSREMTNMIVIQRGFQSNSKSITTLDTMIQKAIELKR